MTTLLPSSDPLVFQGTLSLRLYLIRNRHELPILGLLAADPPSEAALARLAEAMRSTRAFPGRNLAMHFREPLRVACLREPQDETLFEADAVLRMYFTEIGDTPTLGLMAPDHRGEEILTRLQGCLAQAGVRCEAFRRGKEHGGLVDGMRFVSVLERRARKRTVRYHG